MILLTSLVVLATFRLTRLVTTDAFPPVLRLRAWVITKAGDESAVAYLAECSWCVSVWTGGLITLATDRLASGGLAAPVLVWAASSALAGLLSDLEG